MLAKAKAEAQIIESEARSKSIIVVGEAELKIQERANAMPNASLRIICDAQKEVLQGITKVVYTDQQSLLLKPYYNLPDNVGNPSNIINSK